MSWTVDNAEMHFTMRLSAIVSTLSFCPLLLRLYFAYLSALRTLQSQMLLSFFFHFLKILASVWILFMTLSSYIFSESILSARKSTE